MPLEPAFDNLDDLNPANPAANDLVSQADDHMRGIKNALSGNVTGDATETRLLASGIVALSTNAAGASVHDTDGADTIFGFRDDANTLMGQILHSSGLFSVRNLTHGANVQLQSEDSGGTLRNLFTGNPDGIAQMFHAGVKAIGTEVDGGTIQDTAGNNPLLRLRSNVGTELARVFGSASGARMRSLVHGGNVLLEGEDIGGTLRNIFAGDPDGGATLYHVGTQAARTETTGLSILSTSASATILTLRNVSNAAIGQVSHDGNTQVIANLAHGGNLHLRSEDSVGSEKILFLGNPDGRSELRHTGLLAHATTASGIDVYDTSGDDPVIGLRGSGGTLRGDIIADVSGNVAIRSRTASGQVSISVNNAAETAATFAANGAVGLRYNNVERFKTRNASDNYNTSGAQVHDHAGSYYDVGFNLMPVVEADASQTFDEADVSKMIHKDSGGAVTYTLASGTSGAVPPVSSTICIANEDTEDVTISAAGTLRWFNGTGVPATGNRSLAQGGVCTVYKYASAEWWIWGNGLS